MKLRIFKCFHFDTIEFFFKFCVHIIKNMVELAKLFILHPGAVKIITQAMVQFKGSVNAFDDEPQRDVGRIHGQRISAVGALSGSDNAAAHQFAKDLQREAEGDARALGHLAGSDSMRSGLHQHIHDTNRIVRFMCDSQNLAPFVYVFSILSILRFVNR